MSDSPELVTIERCTSQLETALMGHDRELLHYLREEGIITGSIHDTILNPASLLSEAEKAGELVKWIGNRVKQDSQSFHLLVRHFKQAGNLYQPILNKLEAKYAQLATTCRTSDQESLPCVMQQGKWHLYSV